MSALNNLNGKITKDHKIVYNELLSNGLRFIIVWMYYKTTFQIDCFITDGDKYTFSNGVISFNDAYAKEQSKGIITKDRVECFTVNIFGRHKWTSNVSKEYLISKICELE